MYKLFLHLSKQIKYVFPGPIHSIFYIFISMNIFISVVILVSVPIQLLIINNLGIIVICVIVLGSQS